MAQPEGGQPTLEEVRTLVERAGLTLSSEELETFREAVQLTREQVRRLHSVDLSEEDPAFMFHPGEAPS